MFQTGLLTRPQRSVYLITDRGLDVLAAHPDRIDLRVLSQFPELAAFRARRDALPLATSAEVGVSSGDTPEEAIARAYDEVRSALIADLLDRINAQPPDFLERLVLDVLVAMGYGGSRAEAGVHVGQTGDGGIDGIIHQDPLGLDVVYVQAKRWQNTVGTPDVRGFVGALRGRGATKGVFITTSTFSSGVSEYLASTPDRVILIDGAMLAGLMIDHGVGTTPELTYTLARVDTDYFEPDDA